MENGSSWARSLIIDHVRFCHNRQRITIRQLFTLGTATGAFTAGPSREVPINKPRVGYLTRSHESPPCRHAVRERISRRHPSLVRREGQVRNYPGGSALAVSEQDRQGRTRAPPAEPIQHINACGHQGASGRRNQRRYRPPVSVVPERPPAGGAGGP